MTSLFVRPALWLGRCPVEMWRRRLIDGLGPDGVVGAGASTSPSGVVRLQSGYLYHYAFAMLIGVAALVTWYMFVGVH